MTRPFVIGVTGPIASGKSTVVRRLAEHGASVIDADLVYRDLVQPGLPLLAALTDRFGPQILTPEGGLNRKTLGSIVFRDSSALADLDRITHPVIVAEIGHRVDQLSVELAVIEAVKLSRGTARFCDETWLVRIDPGIQLDRLMARNQIDRADAERRIASQMTYDPANFTRIIDNNGTIEELLFAVDDALKLAVGK